MHLQWLLVGQPQQGVHHNGHHDVHRYELAQGRVKHTLESVTECHTLRTDWTHPHEMQDRAQGDAAAWQPERLLEGILPNVPLANIDDLAHGDGRYVGRGTIDHIDGLALGRSLLQIFVCGYDETAHHHIGGHEIGDNIGIAVLGAQNANATGHQHAGGSVKVIRPAGHGLLYRRDHCHISKRNQERQTVRP